MKFTLTALALSGLGLTAAYPAVSNRIHEGGHARFFARMHQAHTQDAGNHLDRLAEVLELTAEQRSEIASLLSETEVFDHVKLLLASHAEQGEAVHSEAFDEAAIRAASAPVGAAQAELAVSVARLMHDVHAVLTEEQLALATAFHPNWRSRLGAHVAKFELSLAGWIEANE